ncbi:hypothetical protein A1O1_09079 [Capronia coronata CBS 617.96]|uniref:Uncharacterized protein n=1 Tax=Capronia coronata CBS 617.96 TaxID=1182541 RepID=W9XDX0_9EURO|nr:uncharacterized protein A1O1_09079 [Capronia coronata CBS 617.96]EXJ78677.1 hypothetical protein A1O1_09079 [Capronia coronata CBS 617.96]
MIVSPGSSRPWFVWALEALVEDTILPRDPKHNWLAGYEEARVNVRARWKEQGYWKDSWTNSMPHDARFGWSPKAAKKDEPAALTDVPGWKSGHESPSPEPPEPNNMDFTPSEIDALEAIHTPPPSPSPPLPEVALGRPAFTFNLFGGDTAPSASVGSMSNPLADENGDHEGTGPGTAAVVTSGESARLSLEDNVDMAPRTEQRRVAPRATPRKQQRRPTAHRVFKGSGTGTTLSTAQSEVSSPVSEMTEPRQRASRAPASRITKQARPLRRGFIFTERERRLSMSQSVKASDQDDMKTQSQLLPPSTIRRSRPEQPERRVVTSKRGMWLNH